MTTKSIITVVFTDNTVKEYEISAGHTVAAYLSRNMSETGSLAFWNDNESYVIPAHSIREFSVKKKQRKKLSKEDGTET